MGRSALGAPGEQIKEGEEEVAGTTFDEPDEELRGPPPQPEGTTAIRAPSGVTGLARCDHIALRPLPCWITRMAAVATRGNCKTHSQIFLGITRGMITRKMASRFPR